MQCMDEQKYFKKILSKFTLDVASGDAIRHLAGKGYTVRQIIKMLDFPTPEDYVQRIVWEYYLEQGILRFEPGAEEEPKYTYIAEYNEYGHKSFRRVPVGQAGAGGGISAHSGGPTASTAGLGGPTLRPGDPVVWTERGYNESSDGPFPEFLRRLRIMDGADSVYVSCDFGLRSKREPDKYPAFLQPLEPEQREYILGLPWERRMIYHRLDERMEGIVVCLYEKSGYHCKIFQAKRKA